MTDLYYKDPVATTPLKMKSRMPADAIIPAHDVESLPGAVESDIGASKGFLATLAGAITASRMAVDLTAAVTGYLQTLASAVTLQRLAINLDATPAANLVTLAGAITAARMAVNVDSATIGKLDAIIAGQGAPGAIYGNKTTVTTPGTRVPLGSSQVLTEGVLLRGLDANTQLVYPGNATVSATTGGTRLAAKEPAFIRANNVNLIYLDAAVAGEGVTWIAW